MINKLLLTGITLVPLASTSSLQAISKADLNTSYVLDENGVEEDESCTFMYVGKDVSKEGKAYIARSGDTGPTALNMNAQIFKHNELAGKTTTGKNGFKWTFPNETYKYISTPRNPAMNKGHHWEVSGINENGVAVSATLTCGTNELAKSFDPLCKTTGITEDNITQIVAATSKTAKEGVQIVAKIIDEVGNGEENAIMILDRNEAWYMEMYTGHQYVAVKMPQDKITTIGNEYMLGTLDGYDDVITSPDYFNLPQAKGFAQYDGVEERKNLNLFNTYAAEGLNGTKQFKDSCHMRTWRGINLFANKTYPEYEVYSNVVKYPSFFKPDQKVGVDEVITFMRDRFTNILLDGSNKNNTYFVNLYKQNKLRFVAYETAYQIHIIGINDQLPNESCVEEWMCLSNSSYSPFVPLTNAISTMDERYTRVTPYYGYDDKSAICIFKRLNSLCAQDHINYGWPVQEYIEEHEQAWKDQLSQIITKIKDLSLDKQKEVLNNHSLYTQQIALQMASILYEDLNWHIMNTTSGAQPTHKEFKPFVNIEYYGYIYGWDYSRKDNIITLTQGDEKITIDVNYKWGEGNEGSITSPKGTYEKCRVQIRDNVPYIDWSVANKYMAIGHKLREININDYFNKLNPLCWILPLVIGVPLVAAAITIPLVLRNKNKKSSKSK